MRYSFVLYFVCLTYLTACSDDPAKNQQFWKAVENAGNALNGQGPSTAGGGGASTMGTGFLKNSYTQGFNKVCVYDRMGSVDTRVVSSTSLCPLTI